MAETTVMIVRLAAVIATVAARCAAAISSTSANGCHYLCLSVRVTAVILLALGESLARSCSNNRGSSNLVVKAPCISVLSTHTCNKTIILVCRAA